MLPSSPGARDSSRGRSPGSPLNRTTSPASRARCPACSTPTIWPDTAPARRTRMPSPWSSAGSRSRNPARGGRVRCCCRRWKSSTRVPDERLDPSTGARHPHHHGGVEARSGRPRCLVRRHATCLSRTCSPGYARERAAADRRYGVRRVPPRPSGRAHPLDGRRCLTGVGGAVAWRVPGSPRWPADRRPPPPVGATRATSTWWTVRGRRRRPPRAAAGCVHRR